MTQQFTPLEKKAMRAMQRAAGLFGGRDALAAHLEMNPRTMQRILVGQQPPPAGVAERMAAALDDAVDETGDERDLAAACYLREFAAQRRTPKGRDQ